MNLTTKTSTRSTDSCCVFWVHQFGQMMLLWRLWNNDRRSEEVRICWWLGLDRHLPRRFTGIKITTIMRAKKEKERKKSISLWVVTDWLCCSMRIFVDFFSVCCRVVFCPEILIYCRQSPQLFDGLKTARLSCQFSKCIFRSNAQSIGRV